MFLRRKAIGPSERLTVTLKYIFAGTSQIDLSGMFRISKTTISRIINETCLVLWNVLFAKKFLAHPENGNQWEAVALEFERKRNFHHCIGAMDGKHIVMQAPARSGSYILLQL